MGTHKTTVGSVKTWKKSAIFERRKNWCEKNSIFLQSEFYSGLASTKNVFVTKICE